MELFIDIPCFLGVKILQTNKQLSVQTNKKDKG